MNREDVYEAFFDTVNDSREWARGGEDNGYADYIDGAVDMCLSLLSVLNRKDQEESRNVEE